MIYLGYCPKGTQLFPLVIGVWEWHAQMFQADIAAGGGGMEGFNKNGAPRAPSYLEKTGVGGSFYAWWAPTSYKCMI